MFNEFKKFALKGNVLDLAVGVIIGGAFGKIVSSLVSDIIMPLVGLLIGNVDFTNLFITLGEGKYDTLEAAKTAGVATLNYGLFLNNVMDFLIIAFSIFLVIKQLNRFTKKKEQVVVPTTKTCKYCYSEIHLDATRCAHCTADLNS
jgi:large conductance mechanosensitive channel